MILAKKGKPSLRVRQVSEKLTLVTRPLIILIGKTLESMYQIISEILTFHSHLIRLDLTNFRMASQCHATTAPVKCEMNVFKEV